MNSDFSLISQVKPKELCGDCVQGKQFVLPFSKKKDKSHINSPLQVIHTDVCGKISPVTNNNKQYFVTFLDEYTHYCVVCLIKDKTEVVDKFKDFVLKAETHFDKKKVKTIYCDNGTEYKNKNLIEFCDGKGIHFHFSPPYTPQLNGVAERLNRTLIEMARTLLITSSLNNSFWGFAILTSAFLLNRLPTRAITVDKTPHELWHNRKPLLKDLKNFGSTVHVFHKTQQSKFNVKSWKGILIGYDPNGYKIWNCEKRAVVVSRDVRFDELSPEKLI